MGGTEDSIANDLNSLGTEGGKGVRCKMKWTYLTMIQMEGLLLCER